MKLSTDKVVIGKTDTPIVPRAGLFLLMEFLEAINIRGLVGQLGLGDQRSSRYTHADFVIAIILMLWGGGQCINHTRQLCRDEAMLSLFDWRLPAPSTIGDWLRRIDAEKLKELNRMLLHRFLLDGKRRFVTLDIDATLIEGNKFNAMITYKGFRGYDALLVFDQGTGYCVGHELRPGNAGPGKHNAELLTKTIADLPEGVTATAARSDSAGYQNKVMTALDAQNVKWSIAMRMNQSLLTELADYRENRWEPFEKGHIIDTIGVLGAHTFRVVALRTPAVDPKRQGQMHYYAVATTVPIEEMSAPELMHWHRQRAGAENCNKEIKAGIGLERLPCGQFEANAVWCELCVLAYNLKVAFATHVAVAEHKTATMASFRWLFIQVAATVTRHAGRVTLRIAETLEPIVELFGTMRRNIRSFAVPRQFNPAGGAE
jgi:hypothetical protein